MTQYSEPRPERIKLVYNAQFPASTAVVLEYLLRNCEFSSRTGRQEAMNAIMAFFHPLAETARGERSVSEVQEIARHCVERLLKQVDMLCTTYQISNPMVNVSSALSKDFRQLEAVLDQGFLRLAGGLQSGAPLPQATVVPSLEQGVEMDGSELGDLEQLLDAPRPGGPATFTLKQTLQLFALACENPADSRRPISHWTPRELADEMVKRGWVESISPRHVGRLLAEADLKPHQVQYWLNPPRPRL